MEVNWVNKNCEKKLIEKFEEYELENDIEIISIIETTLKEKMNNLEIIETENKIKYKEIIEKVNVYRHNSTAAYPIRPPGHML